MKPHTYIGATQRNFQHALRHRLETDFALLGSRKILEFIAEDIQQLVEEFYPPSQRLAGGWMLYTGTKATRQKKPYPGMKAGDFQLVTIPWPLLTAEDLLALSKLPDAKSNRKDWLINRIVRIIEHGLSHPKGPVLLTLADLAAMLGSTTGQIATLLKDAREKTDKALTTKGRYYDIGMKPTHKAEIIALYEQGWDEGAIALKSAHDQSSVGKYIRDYERVKEALKERIPISSIPRLLGMLSSVVNAYTDMVKEYHPDIEIYVKDPNTDSDPETTAKRGVS